MPPVSANFTVSEQTGCETEGENALPPALVAVDTVPPETASTDPTVMLAALASFAAWARASDIRSANEHGCACAAFCETCVP